jgi:hypothetical protein
MNRQNIIFNNKGSVSLCVNSVSFVAKLTTEFTKRGHKVRGGKYYWVPIIIK